MSDMKIDRVELFITTLTGILGGFTNPFKSSLTIKRSDSLSMQGNSI